MNLFEINKLKALDRNDEALDLAVSLLDTIKDQFQRISEAEVVMKVAFDIDLSKNIHAIEEMLES